MGAIFDPKKEKKKTTPGKHRKRQISWMPFFQHQVVFGASLA
jgi:hypothetical protein